MRTNTFNCAILFSIVLTVTSVRAQLGGVVGGVAGKAGGTVNAAASGGVAGGVGAPGNIAGRESAGVFGRETLGPTQSALSVIQSGELSSRMQGLLPAASNLTVAAQGFSDAGQFVTAAHAAHNLNLPFDDLKRKMTGKHRESLEKAVRELSPGVDGRTVSDNLKLAERQSERDFRMAGSSQKDHVATRVASDAALMGHISAMLPAGVDGAAAATGFGDETRFLATLQASHDLGLSFADLKDRVTAGQSLSEAIRGLRPSMDKATADAGAQAAVATAKGMRNTSVHADASASVSASAGHK